MKCAGIALDDWKMPVFKQVLTAAGYEYTEHPGLIDKTLTLKVECEDLDKLAVVIKKANKQAAKQKRELKRKHRNGQDKDLH